MQEVTSAIQCTIPGFEAVTVVYNLLATVEQADHFLRSSGQKGSHEGVVVSVEGWPDKYGPDPWDGKKAPVAWFIWVSKKGWAQAVTEYLNDPN